jgi:hypothetical protein
VQLAARGERRGDGAKQESRGAPAGKTGKLIEKYSTANSDTYELPDGHMLTRVFSQPDAGKDALQAPAPDDAPSSAVSEAAPRAKAALATQGSGSGTDELSCTIDKSTPTNSECNAATFRAGYEPTTQERPVHGLLQFALPNLDNDVTVLNAKLELYETASTTTSEVVLTAAPLLTPWSAGVTWDTTNGSTPWETPGGDYVLGNNANTAPAASGTAKGWHYWYPTEMLQKWLNGTDAPTSEGQSNLGLLVGEEIEGSVNNIVSFAGNGHTDAPALTFEWIQRGIGSATNYTMLPVPVSASTSLEVNAASGNLLVKSNDLTIASRDTPFHVARIFNSLAPEQLGYGAGWGDVNTPHIEVNPNGSVRYVSASGNTFVFDREGLSGGKPAGLRPSPQLQSGPEEAVMCESSGGNPSVCPSKLPKSATYDLLYLKTEEQILFKGTTGTIYPLAVEYIGEELETPSYTTGEVLPTSWADSAKEAIAYTESATLGYTTVAYEAKKESVSYTEKADAAKVTKLVEVTNAAKEKTTYTYGTGAEEGLPTKIEEPGGVNVTISYDPEKQVAKIVTASTTEHPAGSTTAYTYYELGKAPSPCTSTQKATVVTETEGSEELSLIYCANVLDEVESISEQEPLEMAMEPGEEIEDPVEEGEPGMEGEAGGTAAQSRIATGLCAPTPAGYSAACIEATERSAPRAPAAEITNPPVNLASPALVASFQIYIQHTSKYALWGTIRRNKQSYVLGNARNGWHFAKQKENEKGAPADLGTIGSGYKGCGWIYADHIGNKNIGNEPSACEHTPGSKNESFEPKPSAFSSSLDCKACNEGHLVKLEHGTPVCLNVSPLNKPESSTCDDVNPAKPELEPTKTEQEGKTAPQVKWRYVTREGRWVLVQIPSLGIAEGSWAFIERSALPKTLPTYSN